MSPYRAAPCIAAVLFAVAASAAQPKARPDAPAKPRPATPSDIELGRLEPGAPAGRVDLRWLVQGRAGSDERGFTGSDSCADATPISGSGMHVFNLIGSTTDGLPHAECLSGGSAQTYNDLWWIWQPTTSGTVRVETCGMTDVDTRLNVYRAGAVCPPGDEDLVVCDDDACGEQSMVSFLAIVGETYLIRVGSFQPLVGPGPTIGGLLIGRTLAPAETCDEATPIAGSGFFAFDLANASTDGLAHENCAGGEEEQIDRDVWWRWTADSTGPVSMTTCGLATATTRIAVYAPGAECPPGTDLLVTCSDPLDCDNRSELLFYTVAGQEYLIRVGVPPGGEPASGEMRIASGAPFLCSIDICQQYTTGGAYFSGGTNFRVAENWTAPATGSVATLCFWGAYNMQIFGDPPSDNFRVTYYRQSGNLPGTVIATFTGSQLGLVGRVDTGDMIQNTFRIFEYSVCHAPIPVESGSTYWIEIANHIGNSVWTWAQGASGDGLAVQDGTPLDGTWAASPNIGDRAFCIGFRNDCPIDTNGDGVVNFADLNNIVSFINSPCP